MKNMFDLNLELLEKLALELGIEAVGTVSIEKYKEIYNKFHGNDSTRANFDALIRNGKSIIVFGSPFRIKSLKSVSGSEGKGFISPMALKYDYHKVLKAIGDGLAARVGNEVENAFDYKVIVDDYNVSDRILALSSGIGRYGKNGFVINEKLGTAFNIGAVVTTLNIEGSLGDKVLNQDDIYNPQCKICNECVDKCPTRAISNTRSFDVIKDPSLEIDRGRCISAITQKKEELTDFDVSIIGKHKSLYGCDECQVNCPMNIIPQRRFRDGDDDYSLDNLECEVDLEEMLKVSKKEFRRVFGNTGFVWRGYDILSRNAKIVKGFSR